MVKIRKNLSDAEMLKGFSEELSFENNIYAEEKSERKKAVAKAAPKKELLLPEDAQERLNRFLLELSLECMKNKRGSYTWKVTKENDAIVIKPVPLSEKK